MAKATDKKTNVCRGCGVYIEWIKTAQGKWMPVEPKPITIVTKSGYTYSGYIPHWAVCPKADEFKNRSINKN
jgi:hypothetical protein